LAVVQHKEALRRHAAPDEFALQRGRRFVEWLVGHFERTPVDAQRKPGLQVEVNLDGFRRIDMKLGHEPARFVGADRDGGEVAATEAAGDVQEVR